MTRGVGVLDARTGWAFGVSTVPTTRVHHSHTLCPAFPHLVSRIQHRPGKTAKVQAGLLIRKAIVACQSAA